MEHLGRCKCQFWMHLVVFLSPSLTGAILPRSGLWRSPISGQACGAAALAVSRCICISRGSAGAGGGGAKVGGKSLCLRVCGGRIRRRLEQLCHFHGLGSPLRIRALRWEALRMELSRRGARRRGALSRGALGKRGLWLLASLEGLSTRRLGVGRSGAEGLRAHLM